MLQSSSNGAPGFAPMKYPNKDILLSKYNVKCEIKKQL